MFLCSEYFAASARQQPKREAMPLKTIIVLLAGPAKNMLIFPFEALKNARLMQNAMPHRSRNSTVARPKSRSDFGPLPDRIRSNETQQRVPYEAMHRQRPVFVAEPGRLQQRISPQPRSA